MANIEYCGMMPQNPLLAYAYVPYQMSGGTLYSEEVALQRGTIFPALDKPYDVYGKDFYRKCNESEGNMNG